MDIFSHGLWAGVAAKAINNKLEKKGNQLRLNVWFAGFWGAFPDIFAGAVPFVWLGLSVFLGKIKFSDFSRSRMVTEHFPDGAKSIFNLWGNLYDLSHSLVIFFVVFGLVYLLLRRPAWEMLGWLFHILIDIPTHSLDFYPTPFLWPISNMRLGGFSWGTTWFIILNYSALTAAFILFWFRKSRLRKTAI